MVEIFWCCITKEATTAVCIVKPTFQVFNIYAFGDTVTRKEYIITAIINILFETCSLCTTCSTCTLYFRLSQESSCKVISVLPSLLFSFAMLLSFAFEEIRYTFRFRTVSFRFWSWQSWLTPKEILGVSAELCGGIFNFWNLWWSWSIYNNSLTMSSSSLPLLHTNSSGLPSFYLCLLWKC